MEAIIGIVHDLALVVVWFIGIGLVGGGLVLAGMALQGWQRLRRLPQATRIKRISK